MRDYGETDYERQIVRINRALHRKHGVSLLDTLLHEEFHVQYPFLIERMVCELTSVCLPRLSARDKARLYAKLRRRNRRWSRVGSYLEGHGASCQAEGAAPDRGGGQSPQGDTWYIRRDSKGRIKECEHVWRSVAAALRPGPTAANAASVCPRLSLRRMTLVLGVPTMTSKARRRQMAFHTASATASSAFRNHRAGSALNASALRASHWRGPSSAGRSPRTACQPR
jgi:hypothetical protein